MGRWCERSEVGGASLGRVPVWLWAFEALALRLVDGLLELVFLQDAREVELGAGGGGDGDAVVGGDLVGGENGSVKEESGRLLLSHGIVISMRPFQGRRPHRAPAERWLRTPPVARVAAIHRPRRETTAVAHGVHPAVKRVEPARFDPSRDRPPANPRGEQLGPPDDTMLALRKGRDHRVRPKVANVWHLCGAQLRDFGSPSPMMQTKPQQNSLPQCRSSNITHPTP